MGDADGGVHYDSEPGRGKRYSAARRDRERKTGRAADSYSCRAAVRARGENRYAGRDTRVRAETEAGERGRDQDFRVAEHTRSEEHTSELQSHHELVCRLPLEKNRTATARTRARHRERRSNLARPLREIRNRARLSLSSRSEGYGAWHSARRRVHQKCHSASR